MYLVALLFYFVKNLRNIDSFNVTQGADKPLVWPTSWFILFYGENISFDASLFVYINSTDIPPIMIINRIYEHQNLAVAVACFLPGWAKDFLAPL
jgi:hypothetical protein